MWKRKEVSMVGHSMQEKNSTGANWEELVVTAKKIKNWEFTVLNSSHINAPNQPCVPQKNNLPFSIHPDQSLSESIQNKASSTV